MFRGSRLLLAALACEMFVPLAWAKSPSISDWNSIYLEDVRAQSWAPPLVARNLALLHLAAHDAYIVASLGGQETGSPFLRELESFRPGTAPVDSLIASSAACAVVLCAINPNGKSRVEGLVALNERDGIARGLKSADIARANHLGARVATVYLETRATDGASRTVTYVPSDMAGHWRRTPPRFRPPELPGWPLVTPFCLDRADKFRPPAPPLLDSHTYAEAVDEVRQAGRKRLLDQGERTAETAEFWSCFSRTSTPVGHWNVILDHLIHDRGLLEIQTHRAFAVLNVALADAAVACWDSKYHYRFWRPVDAIRLADQDGNSKTESEPSWESLLEAPPHPEYVSGHSAFAGAGAEILKKLFPSDKVSFRISSDSLPNVQRHYESFTECAREMGESRIYGGIHFSFSNREGQKLGQRVGSFVWKRFEALTEASLSIEDLTVKP